MGNFVMGLAACANACTPCALSSALLMDGCRAMRDCRARQNSYVLSYDHLGGIVKFDGPDRVGLYFLERWGEGIIRAHAVLERFLVFRRKSARNSYEDFTWLFKQAASIHKE